VQAATLHRSDFVQQNAANIKTNKLPPLAILGQKSLDRLKIQFRSKSKITPLFVTKGQRVKQSNEKNHTTITPLQCLRRIRVNRVIISTDKNVLKS